MRFELYKCFQIFKIITPPLFFFFFFKKNLSIVHLQYEAKRTKRQAKKFFHFYKCFHKYNAQKIAPGISYLAKIHSSLSPSLPPSLIQLLTFFKQTSIHPSTPLSHLSIHSIHTSCVYSMFQQCA